MTPRFNPMDMTSADAAVLFSKALKKPVTESEIKVAIVAGMPTDAYGNLNIVEIAAWLNLEGANSED